MYLQIRSIYKNPLFLSIVLSLVLLSKCRKLRFRGSRFKNLPRTPPPPNCLAPLTLGVAFGVNCYFKFLIDAPVRNLPRSTPGHDSKNLHSNSPVKHTKKLVAVTYCTDAVNLQFHGTIKAICCNNVLQ